MATGKRSRNYSAEHQRRIAAARDAGFESYWDYRVSRWGPDPQGAARAARSRRRRRAAA